MKAAKNEGNSRLYGAAGEAVVLAAEMSPRQETTRVQYCASTTQQSTLYQALLTLKIANAERVGDVLCVQDREKERRDRA